MVEGETQNPPRSGEGDRRESGGGGGPRVLQTPIKQVKRARKLRREMSLPEVLLWKQLQKRPGGFKYRKQFPFEQIIVDFACLETRLIIEVDGEGHSFGDRPTKDAARDAILARAGFQVMRVAAREVLKNMDGVVSGIVARCSEVGPLHQPAAGPPPRAGEELA